MERDAFTQRIEAAEKRLGALTEEQRKDSSGLWDELSDALEELRAADEALHRQRESGQEAQMANRLLRSLLDVMPVGVIVCNEDGAILMNNRAAEDILGSIVVGDVRDPERTHTPHRLDGSPFPPGEMPLVRALEHGEVARDVEILIKRADGEERVVVAGAAPVRDEAGHIISGVAVFQDITRHKQAEEAVQDLAKFPSENPNPVIRVMRDGTIHYANQGAQCLLDEWGTRVGQQLPDEWRTRVAEAFETSLGRTAEISCSGQTFTFTIVPVKESGYVNLYGTDITDLQEAEEALLKAKEELETRVEERTAELQRANEQLQEENRERIRTEQSLRLEEARLDALLHLSQIDEASLEEVSAFTLEQAIALTHSKIGFVGLLSEDESTYTLHAVSKDVVKECRVTGDPLQWHVVDAGIWADAIRERKTLFINDYSQPHPRKKGFPPGHPYVERFMAVPILQSGRIVAIAGVGNKTAEYDKSDERQVALLLSGMWSYVQRNRSREELQEAYDQLEEKVEQRTAELAASTAALQESQRDLARAQEVGQIGSWRLDVRRDVLTWSDENHRIFGVPKGTPMTYETFLEMVHPEDRQFVDMQWQAGLRGEPYDIEHRIVVDGQIRWVREKAYLESDDAGVLLGGFGITQDITDRRRAREERERLAVALDQERRTLQAIMENTPTHLAYLDSQFNFVMVNPAYAESAGHTQEQMIGHAHFELFPNEGDRAVFERVRETGEPVKFVAKPFEFPDRPELGTTYWDWTLAPVEDTEGQVLGLVLSLMDVTEQEQARQKLRQYTDRLRVLHEADQAILAARSVDEIAESALGCVPQLLEGCGWAGVALYDLDQGEASLLAVHTEAKTRLGKGWRGPLDPAWLSMLEPLGQGRPRVIEDMQEVSVASTFVEILQAEGLRAYVIVPLLIEGELIGSLDFGMSDAGGLRSEQMEVAVELADELAVGIWQARLNEQVRQHTEELKSLVARRTQALRDREARLRAIFDGAGIGIAVLDVDGRVEESNPALQELLGYSAKELHGKLLTDFSHPDDTMADVTFYKELMAQKKGVGRYRTERRYVRRDGRLCWASVTASLVRVRRRKPEFVIVMIEDITEQKQAQKALIQSERLNITGRLAASLAHEINNPLQSVIGCLGLAQESLETGDEAEVRELLQVAAEELRRAAGFVSDLRDLNRPSDPSDRKPVEVNLQIEHVLMLTREQCQKSDVEVEWLPAEGLPALMLVADRVQQVFLNLTLNALEAMPGGGRLRISTDYTGDPARVRVTFADTGSGIAANDLAHVFEPFYTTKTEGLGLGLYITRNIIEEHGGYIEVESLPGEGATFTVWLPVEEETSTGEG